MRSTEVSGWGRKSWAGSLGTDAVGAGAGDKGHLERGGDGGRCRGENNGVGLNY